MMEAISINKGFSVALRLGNCPSDYIDSMCSSDVIERTTCKRDLGSIACSIYLNDTSRRRLHSPDIKGSRAPMFYLRNCLPIAISSQDRSQELTATVHHEAL